MGKRRGGEKFQQRKARAIAAGRVRRVGYNADSTVGITRPASRNSSSNDSLETLLALFDGENRPLHPSPTIGLATIFIIEDPAVPCVIADPAPEPAPIAQPNPTSVDTANPDIAPELIVLN